VAGAVDGAHPIATAACSLDHGAEEPSRVKVVADQAGRALYFSRLPIPRGGPWRLHLGIYAFAASALQAVAALPVGALERAESLEQLRWLEAGWAIKVVAVERGEPGVDTPADLERARTRVREVET
jgi:3-deoxy-manno-octulosonate cytidylyltransferase (CMP-KDO synthetase)